MENKLSSNEKSLKQILTEWIKSPGIRKHYLRVVIKEAWTDNMGPMVLKYTKSMSVRKGVLHIKVSSAPLRQELLLNKTKILTMLNVSIGEPLLEDMVVT